MANIGYLQVVRICNQKCRFCSNPDNEQMLEVEAGKEVIDELVRSNYEGVFFTGGEPTVYEHLEELIAYATEKGLTARLISNGQNLVDKEYLKGLQDAGLVRINISLHSSDAKAQGFITGKEDSFACIDQALVNARELDIPVDINTTINAYNQENLHETAEWLVENHPSVRHVVYNNLDPSSSRARENPDVLPTMRKIELSLGKALRLLDRTGRTFRVERLPLCYMVEYAHCSTETRKIVKEEERFVHFLDHKGDFRQTQFDRDKAECCKVCTLNPVCAGLYGIDEYYDSSELYPVFVPVERVIQKVLQGDAGDGWRQARS